MRAETAANPPPEVTQLLDLMADPAVQDWLRANGTVAPPPAAPAPPDASMVQILGGMVAVVRAELDGLGAEIPKLPAQLERAGIILGLEFEGENLLHVVLLIVGFIALGFGTQWLYRRLMRPAAQWLIAQSLETVSERLRAVAVRVGYGLGLIGSFTVGSVGAFLALDWPLLLREIVLGYLAAFVAMELARVLGRFLLAPGGERFRIVPVTTPAAFFWHHRSVALIGLFAFGSVTLGTLGLSPEARRLLALGLGFALLVIGLEAIWRRPGQGGSERAPTGGFLGRWAKSWLVSLYLVLLWLLWAGNAMAIFWVALVAVGLPFAIRITQRSVNHILRPTLAAGTASEPPGLIAVALERGLRAALIIGAALLLAHAWNIDLGELAASDSAATRLLRGVLNAVVILLLTDLGWHLARTLIDRKVAEAQNASLIDSEDARRQARLRTLLPILKNILLVVLLIIAALMVLSAVGVEIGPLIAGAGVVGVAIAIGFGAQTLVKDIISGVFFLLDDAFRLGEYIQSGSYKGTVESFSLRSVKLRHHRGSLFTVPFGELGAVQNMSRDWVIDKMNLNVTYGTDLEKMKKIIKQIGKDLLDDPEFAPHIIETLKMQGVEQFGDYAVQIRLRIMTKLSEQFVIRRKAYALIKKSFDANGIDFAVPTVQVSGGEGGQAAAARQTMEARKAPGPA